MMPNDVPFSSRTFVYLSKDGDRMATEDSFEAQTFALWSRVGNTAEFRKDQIVRGFDLASRFLQGVKR